MESDDAAVLKRRFLEAVAVSTPPLHAKDLRVPGLDRRTVQKRLERLRRSVPANEVASDEEAIAFARDELLRTGDPRSRGLARLRALGSPLATEFARRAAIQAPVVGDWVELAHSPGDLGWMREQVEVEELAPDTIPARGRAQGWGEERDRYLNAARARAERDPDLRRNLDPNLPKMDLAGLRSWGTTDSPLCAIQVAPVDWLTCFALNARLDEQALSGDGTETVRERWGEPLRTAERRGLPGMIVAHIVVLTADQQFVVCRRQRAGVEDERGTWSLSIEERWQAQREGHVADHHPHDLVRRAVHEELGLAVADEDVRILAWGLERSVLYPGFLAVARAKRGSWEVAALRGHAADASELAYVTFIPARLGSARLLLEDPFVPPDRPDLAGRAGRSRVLAQLGR